MEKNKLSRQLPEILKFVCSRVLFLYIILFLFVAASANGRKVLFRAQMSALSRFMPEHTFLVQFNDRKVELDQRTLRHFRNYFKKVADYMPGRWDVYAMSGFCDHYSGQDEKAIVSYNRSISLNPKFFWNYYNLGLLYFQSKNYQAAARVLEQAIILPPGLAVQMIYSSKLYYPALEQYPNFKNEILPRIREAAGETLRMLAVSYQHLNDTEGLKNVIKFAIAQGFNQDGFFTSILRQQAPVDRSFGRVRIF